ncbi:MAG TPA: potassium transporter, partial [Chromatiales bacterium]|nr:potassium transporter [Chromatiales bacterium]
MLLPFLGAATGSLLLIHSGTLLIPAWTSFMDHDGQLTTLVILLLAEAGIGLALWATFRGLEGRLRTRDGFVLVSFTWAVVSALGTLPLILCLDMSVTNAVFESVSGVTTTGATVLTGLDEMPRSILFYRQELQWLGGVGVVVLAIALFPMLRIGGMQLLKAETPGPVKSEKLRPRLRETARSLWLVYILLTTGCALFYWISGMSFFDAVAHSLSTVSTGGFSTHDASLGFFDSQAVELTAIVFMILASINFSLHYITLHQFSLSHYFSNEEVRALIGVIAVVIGIVSLMLFQQGVTTTIGPALRHAAFQVVSVITSTGFATRDFTAWP